MHRFVLVGPNAGRTMQVNGRPFVEGAYDFVGSADEARNLARIFSFYGAVPEGLAPVPAKPQEGDDGMAEILGVSAVAPVPEPVAIPLGEALGELDPERDGDWTSNNLPSLERLTEITGERVSRSQVEAIAEGFTRAKARQARA